MYLLESHFNSKASDCAIEEVYTDIDINKNCEYDPKIGYSFYYPYRFINDPAQLKAVGIRRLNLAPSNHVINFKIVIYPLDTNKEQVFDSKGDFVELIYNGCITVDRNTSLVKGMDKMRDNINNYLKENHSNYKQRFGYKYSDNKLTLYIDDVGEKAYGIFCLTCPNDELSKFLNQPLENLLSDEVEREEYVFDNVWDREYIEFHASFSDSNRNFIGRNNSFYTRPSLFYLVPANTTGFNITFSSDGVTPILPRYCKFIIQLCFVLNYKMFRI